MSKTTSDPAPFERTPQAVSAIKRQGEFLKVTAVLAVVVIAFFIVRHKLIAAGVTVAEVKTGLANLPPIHMLAAVLLTTLNYIVLTGYDWIAVRHLGKKLAMSRIMAGAVVGYACGNVLGWLFGGNAVRYRMYSTWGFSLVEIIAFISILSITFWLGLFLLAGIAFVALPIHLPEEVLDKLGQPPHVWGYIFLACVGGYLLSCLLIRRPIRFRDYQITLPPFYLSTMQLMVSAGDFLLASTVLYSLIPPEAIGPDKINFSTVLIAYLTAQICAVITHVPGGIGILEGVLLSFLPIPAKVICAVILFRVFYYLLPALVAGGIFIYNEFTVKPGPSDPNPHAA